MQRQLKCSPVYHKPQAKLQQKQAELDNFILLPKQNINLPGYGTLPPTRTSRKPGLWQQNKHKVLSAGYNVAEIYIKWQVETTRSSGSEEMSRATNSYLSWILECWRCLAGCLRFQLIACRRGSTQTALKTISLLDFASYGFLIIYFLFTFYQSSTD